MIREYRAAWNGSFHHQCIDLGQGSAALPVQSLNSVVPSLGRERYMKRRDRREGPGSTSRGPFQSRNGQERWSPGSTTTIVPISTRR
jgi:hypothetical protein